VVVWDFAVFDVAADEVAEDAAIVLVARITHEGAGVGDHADEAGQEAEVGEGVELPFHAFFLVEKPPGRAELDFARDAAVHEVAEHGTEDVVIGGIEVVEDGTREALLLIEAVEEEGQVACLREIADGIESGVGAEFSEPAGVVVAHGAEVELHDPVFCGVEAADVEHDMGGEGVAFVRADGPAAAGFAEDGAQPGFRGEGGEGAFESVVRGAAAEFGEGVVAAFECVEEIVPGGDIHVCRGGQLVHPGVPRLGLVDVEGLVRAEGGHDFEGEVFACEGLVVAEVVGRVVGGGDESDVEFLEDAACGELGSGEALVGAIPDLGSSVFVEEAIDAEVTFEFEVGPVEERVAEGMGHGACPGEEFFVGRRVAGAVAFVHAVGAHGAPFVVVAFEPDFEEVLEAPVFGQVARRQVAVEIEDGFRLGVLVVEPARGARGQQKVLVNEALHDFQQSAGFVRAARCKLCTATHVFCTGLGGAGV